MKNFPTQHSLTYESNCSCVKYFPLHLSSDLQSLFFFLRHVTSLFSSIILQLSRSSGRCVKCEKLKLVNTEKQHLWTLNAQGLFFFIWMLHWFWSMQHGWITTDAAHPLLSTFKICSALFLTPYFYDTIFLWHHLLSVGNLCMFSLNPELLFQLKVRVKSGHGVFL